MNIGIFSFFAIVVLAVYIIIIFSFKKEETSTMFAKANSSVKINRLLFLNITLLISLLILRIYRYEITFFFWEKVKLNEILNFPEEVYFIYLLIATGLLKMIQNTANQIKKDFAKQENSRNSMFE